MEFVCVCVYVYFMKIISFVLSNSWLSSVNEFCFQLHACESSRKILLFHNLWE